MIDRCDITTEDQALLDEAFECIVGLVEDGREVRAADFLDGREDLRPEIDRLIELAEQVAVAPRNPKPQIRGYTLLSELGRGGMGTVYLARQDRLGGRAVALKVLPHADGR